MQPVNHPIAPEELMAYLDGELPADRAVDAAAHLEQCSDCRNLAAGLRDVSQSLAVWEIEPAGPRMARALEEALREKPEAPAPVAMKPRRPWLSIPKWGWALGGVCGLLLVVVMMHRPAPEAYQLRETMESRAPQSAAVKAEMAPTPPAAPIVTNPMIARTATLQITARNFDQIRGQIEAILKRHKGYFGELNVDTPNESSRTLRGKLQVPADQLDSTLNELKQLGHVDSETQSGEEVTAAYVDLEARLANARHTEARIVDVLRERTGKLSEVLEAEEQLGRVRGEIEQMEAERRGLLKRVDFSSVTLTVNEEYKSQMHVSDSLGAKFRNSAVDGFRSMVGSLVAVGVFLLADGPVLLLWAAILFFPARYAWRRWKRSRA